MVPVILLLLLPMAAGRCARSPLVRLDGTVAADLAALSLELLTSDGRPAQVVALSGIVIWRRRIS